MWEACSPTGSWWREFLILAPLLSALVLMAGGALLTLLWLKLRRWWRIVPLVLMVAIGVAAMLPKWSFDSQIADAHQVLKSNRWREGDAFVLKGAIQEITAYLIPSSGGCMASFVVVTEGEIYKDARAFAGGFPNSPADLQAEKVHSFVTGSYHRCSDRYQILRGSDWYRPRWKLCEQPHPAMLFYAKNRSDLPGFEMDWCRELNDKYAYCEAHGQTVGLALGNQY